MLFNASCGYAADKDFHDYGFRQIGRNSRFISGIFIEFNKNKNHLFENLYENINKTDFVLFYSFFFLQNILKNLYMYYYNNSEFSFWCWLKNCVQTETIWFH